MNKRKQTVMSILKPKVKAFGFNRKEIEGIAARIADNLASEEDASEEDVKAEIEKAIENILPYLEFGQSFANRVINDHKNGNEDDDREDDDDAVAQSKKPKSQNKPSGQKEERSDDTPAWAKALIKSNEDLRTQIAQIKGEKVTESRKSKLEALLKDSGTFGSRLLKSFSRMKFENDEEFDEFFSDVEEDLKSFNQERANVGLGKLGAPAKGNQKRTENKDELSDDEIKAIASTR